MPRLRTTLLLMTCLAAGRLSAQRIWLPPSVGHYFGVEAGKGFFDLGGAHLGFSTLYATVMGRVVITPTVSVTGELPLTHLDYESQGGITRVGTKVGDPWLGVQLLPRDDLSVEVGARIPVATTSGTSAALSYALAADLDHFEAWYPKTSSIRGLVRYGRLPEEGGFYTAMAGLTYLLPDQSIATAKLLFANYGFRAGWVSTGTVASVALMGDYLVNRHGYSIDTRMVNEVSAGFERSTGRIRPQASIRTFLDPSYRRNTKAVITVGALVTF